MLLSRRECLINGAAAFGLLIGNRLFAAPKGWKHGGKPNLVFGVVSDTHLRTSWNGRTGDRFYTRKYFVSALEYFRDRNVDAVVHLGDMANNGQVEAMQFHADAWRDVFPDDRAPDGHKVERLFINGNHDVEGFKYTAFMEKLIKDPEEREKHLLVTDMAGNWERIWGEPYEEVWHKVVKGYHFYGRHWGTNLTWGAIDTKMARLVKADGERLGFLGERKPVFLLSHRLQSGWLRKHLRSLCNGVGFFGHCHFSSSNWNTIYLNENAGETFPCIQCPACHSSRGEAFPGRECAAKVTIEGGDWKRWKSRQGFVVRVYDDMLVIERKEFDNGVASVGPDWVMPFNWETYPPSEASAEGGSMRGGNGEYGTAKHPFSKEELKKVIGEPQFRERAKLEVSLDRIDKINKIEKSSNNNPFNPVNPAQDNSASLRLCVKIPLADGNPDSRVYAYEVVVVGDEGTPKLHKAVYAAGCNMGIGHEPNGGVTTLEIPASELPPGKTLTVAARPLSSLGTSGKAIATEFKA